MKTGGNRKFKKLQIIPRFYHVHHFTSILLYTTFLLEKVGLFQVSNLTVSFSFREAKVSEKMQGWPNDDKSLWENDLRDSAMKVSGTLVTNCSLGLEPQGNESQGLESRSLYSVEVASTFSEKVVFHVSKAPVSETENFRKRIKSQRLKSQRLQSQRLTSQWP